MHSLLSLSPVNRWEITWDKERWQLPFLWKLIMQDDQKDALPECAIDNSQRTSVAPHLSLSWIFTQRKKLENTTHKNTENKLKCLSLECSCLPRPGITVSLYGD